MGVNAQTTVPTFTVGQILTAAEQNTGARTGVPVFATTVTRDAAFGGANKTLAEGQLCYLESTDVVQYYTGAAWATVGPATASALVRVGGGSLTGAAVTFSSVFSATYDAYLVEMTNLVGSTTLSPNLTFGSAVTNYKYGQVALSTTAINFNTGSAAASSIFLAQMINTITGSMVLEILNPNLAKATDAYYRGMYSTDQNNFGWGKHQDATSHTSFTLTASTGTFTSGTVNIYGYSLS